MNPKQLDWPKIKGTDYLGWRGELWKRTLEALTSSDEVYLSQYNQAGYFHRVPDREYFDRMKQDWTQSRKVPQEWIAKGIFPGIWTAMFDPHNTYSYAAVPVHIVRFYFKPGFRVYDGNNPKHKNLGNIWVNGVDTNPWENVMNENGLSLRERVGRYFLGPSHKKFFEDHRFGAVIGYSDYISPVILLEESVEDVEFLKF